MLKMVLTSAQKAAVTRNRNYVMKASREHIIEILRDSPDLTEVELLGNLRFYEGLLAYRNMLALKAAAKAAH
jgi:hypothetical protein